MLIAAALLLSPWEPTLAGDPEAFFQQEKEKEKEKPEDVEALRRRIEGLEKKRAELDRKIQDALEKSDGDAAVKARDEQKKVDQELKEARLKLESRPAEGGFAWGVEAILTHWDNDLDLGDGAGWSAYVSLIPAVTFQYSRWETEDEDGDDDALVQVYRIGFGTTGHALTDLALGLAGSVGLVRFNSEVSSHGADNGPIFSLHPSAAWRLGRNATFSAGVLIDILRTDFNNEHTHTMHNVSGTVGLHVHW